MGSSVVSKKSEHRQMGEEVGRLGNGHGVQILRDHQRAVGVGGV